ncbi:MAG: hypothetical protein OEZ47_16550, partial [Gammaproteobacteria bacterium]|nr:hypothetical protein [Gammaproteobacteria bacterium]
MINILRVEKLLFFSESYGRFLNRHASCSLRNIGLFKVVIQRGKENEMKLFSKTKSASCSVALAVALAAGTALPTVAGADGLTTNIAVSNMYLWRGQNLSPNGGVVSGG